MGKVKEVSQRTQTSKACVEYQSPMGKVKAKNDKPSKKNNLYQSPMGKVKKTKKKKKKKRKDGINPLWER